jgi:hypothetical protein
MSSRQGIPEMLQEVHSTSQLIMTEDHQLLLMTTSDGERAPLQKTT